MTCQMEKTHLGTVKPSWHLESSRLSAFSSVKRDNATSGMQRFTESVHLKCLEQYHKECVTACSVNMHYCHQIVITINH
jgi:hypothetical protein